MSADVSRRVTLAWVVLAGASPWLAADGAEAAEVSPPDGLWQEIVLPPLSGPGYGQDPHLRQPAAPWPLTLDPAQRASLRDIAEVMLPADAHSPSAATLKIDAFIDEWISAPYPQQQRDRGLILSGLAWLDAEARNRYASGFGEIGDGQRRALYDAIAFRAHVPPGYERPARFFARLRALMMAGFYSLPEGMADIGYTGNKPHFGPYPGPPQEAIDHLNASLIGLGLRPVSPD